ncbi:DUF5082 family protein [Aquibacillus rhizosphaerae]|uniref:DUF5082 family protein n=1 Tax=Aquibacillus rhizosphaerae TaxID=3051431 RepID=A0ABT7L3V5_9BACI|nr:DUF5082 family protein [Aquibacillus sp. LR5S19]MDL4840551.1 DUF5082 family protein [Aquibacillus sp. LR5S19]
MSFWSTIMGLQNDINQRANSVEEKISRLRDANAKIQREQESMLHEIKMIKKPNLGTNWRGEFADQYENEREDAYDIMWRTGHFKYEYYQTLIQTRLVSLEVEKSSLDFLNGMANQASNLLSYGEEAYDRVEDKISNIRRGLF